MKPDQVAHLEGEAERIRREIAQHLAVWTREPITRCPVGQVARDEAARAAFDDGNQNLHKVIT